MWAKHACAILIIKQATSGERMVVTLVIIGVLAAAVVGLTIFSAVQDIKDDY